MSTTTQPMKETRSGKSYGGSIEARAAGEGQKQVISGYAANYGVITDMGWYFEEILPGAFEGREADDVIAAFNHEEELILARTTAGTLELKADEKGLFYSFEVPELSYAKDLAENIRLKNVTQSSFMFSVAEAEWVYEYKNGKSLRRIKKLARLYDVSPVVWPAYETEELSVDQRSKMMVQPPAKPVDVWVLDKQKREREITLLGINQ